VGLYFQVWLLVLAVLVWPFSAGRSQSDSRAERVLLTSQEAEQVRLSEAEWQSPSRTRSLPSGPRILIQRPGITLTDAGPTIETNSPTDLIIFFEARRAPVNMDSLQVKAKKGLFAKSLTDRLRPYIEGMSLQAKQLKIPEGRFLIEIAIADRDGVETVETYHLHVRQP
jgi:hypothetical protein